MNTTQRLLYNLIYSKISMKIHLKNKFVNSCSYLSTYIIFLFLFNTFILFPTCILDVR